MSGSAQPSPPRLTRRSSPGPAPWPVRMVHVGPGAFFRAHTAWATAAAEDGWGIAAVGRPGSAAAAALADQGGLYSLLTRGGPDRLEVVRSVSEVGVDLGRLADPAVGVVTLTVTEAGYGAGSTLPAALAAALERRLAGGGAPLAVVTCDNLAGAGSLLRAGVLAAAPRLAGWVEGGGCRFASSVVDRITPAPTDADRAEVARRLGRLDGAATVAEEAFEWVVEDAFPAGRPGWEAAGAVVTADPGPWAARKLRVLNAGHSLLALLGGPAGHRFVHEAVADPAVGGSLAGLWDEAAATMDPTGAALADAAYRASLLRRFGHRRLPHPLAQIATDSSAKLAARVAPTLRASGVGAPVSASVVGGWVACLRGAAPWEVRDVGAGELRPIRTSPDLGAAATAALAVLDPALAEDLDLRAAVSEAARRALPGAARRGRA